MPDFYRARQCLEYALQELDGEGTPHERLTSAWLKLTDLGSKEVAVPSSIAQDVRDMHGQVAKWLLPRQTGALGTAISWMDNEECQAAIDLIQTWRRAVDVAIAQNGES